MPPEDDARILNELSAFSCVHERVGDTLYFYCRDGHALMRKLLELDLPNTLHRPATLEDVFLKLTGRSLHRMNLSYRVLYVFLSNLYSYKRFVVPTFLVSLVQPLFYLITFGIGMGAYMGAFGGKPYLHFLVPGVLITAVMMSSSFECLYGTFIKMVHEKLYESLIATPVSADDAVAGDILWGSFRGLISGSLMMIVALVMGVAPASAGRFVLLLVFMVFVGILFGSLAMIVTSIAPNFDFFSYYTELVVTPMLFFSGVFFPLDEFPGWMKTLAQFMPLTHVVRISRSLFTGEPAPGIWGSLAGLVVLTAVIFGISTRMMRKRLIK